MRQISGGRMTLAEMTNEIVFYVNQGVENIFIQISRDKKRRFITKIYVGERDEEMFSGNLPSVFKLS